MDTSWKTAFRQQMKKHEMTFAELADKLEMSTPGIKKIFQKENISLERFKQICRVLELNPSEVLEMESRRAVRIKSLSKEADAYLAKEERALNLYWLLAIEKLTLSEAIQVLNFSKADTYGFLRNLDRFGLVKWLENDEVKVPDGAPFVFGQGTTCAEKFARKQALALISAAFDNKPTHQSHLSVRYLNLPPEILSELAKKMADLADDISRKYPPVGRHKLRERGQLPAQMLICLRRGQVQFGEAPEDPKKLPTRSRNLNT